MSSTNSWKTREILISFTLITTAMWCGCKNKIVDAHNTLPVALTDTQIARLADKKIFFGHQSVGKNIIQGIRELAANDPRLKLRILHSDDLTSVTGPALVEFDIGTNGNPQSKNDAFFAVLSRGMGQQSGTAMFKYCYVDFDVSTDVTKVFKDYQATVDAIKTKYPHLKIVHITVPLTTVEPWPKAWLKSILGRPTLQDINVKRNEFNDLLRASYNSTEVFDLAAAESTRPDGSREFFQRNGTQIYTLCPEFTDDGGHLNATGRRVVAETLLLALSNQ